MMTNEKEIKEMKNKMKTAKQWIDESNWSDELKELFWERTSLDKDTLIEQDDLLDFSSFIWVETPEGRQFWADVANGKRTDIDRPENTDQEYETLFRKALEGLKGKEVGTGNDDFTRGYNTGIREMNAKIDDLLKKLELCKNSGDL